MWNGLFLFVFPGHALSAFFFAETFFQQIHNELGVSSIAGRFLGGLAEADFIYIKHGQLTKSS